MSDGRASPGRAGPLRMALLFGGASTEHTISVRSARAVLAAADPARIAAVPIAIGRDGSWHDAAASRALIAAMDRGAPECVPPASGDGGGLLAAPAALSALAGVDLAFPLVHGQTGEDGSLQGLLELCGVPYVGAGVAASAIGMDKALMKALFAKAGLPLPRTRVVTAAEWASGRESLERELASLPLPLFAKAANGGSSVGVVKIHDREEIGPGVEEALRFDAQGGRGGGDRGARDRMRGAAAPGRRRRRRRGHAARRDSHGARLLRLRRQVRGPGDGVDRAARARPRGRGARAGARRRGVRGDRLRRLRARRSSSCAARTSCSSTRSTRCPASPA